MQPGDVIAERFGIERLVGSGGMGAVFLARDRSSGEPVALKVLHDGKGADRVRFKREAEVLAELSHPGVVRHVAHGVAASGELYLAMEWLSGEDLAERLRRGPLTMEETVTLVTRVAEALASVHARGIAHRDLKPSNLFLVERDVTRVKVLDFGIAWLPARTRMTQTGALLGTPAYMAPEQARSDGHLDQRVDVFALGSVLFECVSGRPAFMGAHFLAVLGKILFDEVPRLREIAPATPPLLDALCGRMLAKNPEERPRDGAEVAAALRAMGLAVTLGALDPGARAAVSSPTLTQSERRLLSVVLMGRPPLGGGAAPGPDLRGAIEARGGRLEILADGSLMVTIVGAGMATDQAGQAARCAFALRDALEGRWVAIATGRAEVGGRLPVAALLDRAAQMLAELAPPAGPPPIAVDDVTAGLLDGRFEVVEADAGFLLQREQAPGSVARRLLGKLTPCVGRDVELGTLTASFVECVEESTARAVLVTAPAGMGKTRLGQELLARLRHRGEPFALWIAGGDPMRTGAALGLLGRALAGALGIQDGEPVEARRARLSARVAAHVGAGEARRVAEFIGEIVGTPFPEGDSITLRAARQDTRLMGDQMRRAWVDLLGGWCSSQPVLLVLEDLHWGDLPTVQFIDEALRRLKDRPWMVLGLGRPSLHARFAGLWADRKVQEIRLGELGRKASARLVRQVLGEAVAEETVDRLVTHADGNAFYLEELIRAAADGRGGPLPETVLSMLQGRLEALDSVARRVLRAASVFGETFWQGAVEALLGGVASAPALAEQLEHLERQEWVHARQASRFQGEREWRFRHALVREAAYGMLTDDDRALGHRLAGAWLEQVAEPSAAVIGEHFERGGETMRAAWSYQRAAEQALAANDFGAVLSWTERALSLGGIEPGRGELALLRAEALAWRGDYVDAASWARDALGRLPEGSPRWYAAAGEVGRMALALGRPDRLAELSDRLTSAWSEQDATGPAVAAVARMIPSLLSAGLFDRAEALHALIEAVAARFSSDPAVLARIFRARYLREQMNGDLSRCRALSEVAIESFERAGDLRSACLTRCNLGYVECMLGAYREAVVVLRATLVGAEQMGLENVAAAAWNNLGLALGDLEEARAAEQRAVRALSAQGDKRLLGNSREYLARILRRAGELEAAEAEAREAVALLDSFKPLQIVARGTLADVLLARGQRVEALAQAREAMELLVSMGRIEEGEALVRLAHAEALEATGDHAAARAAIAEARARLLATAGRIDDESRRTTFLENVPENARTLALARAWLGDPAV